MQDQRSIRKEDTPVIAQKLAHFRILRNRQYMRYLAVGSVILALQACSLIDDYLLGKDNTPKPRALSAFESKVTLKQRWTTSVGHSQHAHTYLKLKPVVRGGIVYSADASGGVSAVNMHTGRLLWSQRIQHPVVSGPTVAGNQVIVGTDSSTLVAVNAANGQTQWEAHLSEDALSKSFVAGSRIICKSIDGHLYAFDINSGKKVWETEHGSPNLILKASSSPVRMGPLILVGFSDGKLDAVSPEDGRLIWQRSIAYATGASDVERLVDIDADPIVRDQTIYLASYQGYIGALDGRNGQFIWNKPGSVYKNMVIDNSTLYVTDSHDVLWAFDRYNGQVKWKQAAFKARNLTEPVLMGNTLVVGDRLGYLHLLSTQTGEVIGRTELSAGIDISPAVFGNTLYVLTTNGQLTALNLQV